MKNKIKSVLVAAKNHVKDNKFAYAATGVALGAIALQQSNRKCFYEFLETKGIDPMEYYNPEYFVELNS